MGRVIVGVDETGRGSCVGPVITCAVAFPHNHIPPTLRKQLRDSKALSEAQRLRIAAELHSQVLYAFGAASAKEVDTLNPLHASMLAMCRAVGRLNVDEGWVVVDGNYWPKQLEHGRTLVKADAIVHQVKAASILAKVFRDHLLDRLDIRYPVYGLEKHSGYGTKKHFEAIKEFGLSPHHRKTFVKKLLSGKD